jgi:hypothetical protein
MIACCDVGEIYFKLKINVDSFQGMKQFKFEPHC